uniref:Sorting nexin-3 n=1 Tax=Meloidogyne javanica TaxID=6303 RepID=A0A915MU28_MELJA
MKSEKKSTSSANKKHPHSIPTNQLQNSTESQEYILPATSAAPLTNRKSSRLQQQQQKQMFNEAAVRNNFYVLEQSRTCQSAVSGIASGILGLTGIMGFVFYFVCVLLQALIWDYKAGMTCSKCTQLENELEQKNAQIVHYEGKISVTVNAYKMLETQKQSLEVALGVLSEKMPDETNSEGNKGDDSIENSAETSSQLKEEAKEEAQKRATKFEDQLNQQLQKTKSQNLRRLREQLAESQSELERAMTEHGMILAEMQQQYGREKRRSENLENQITEMSQRLALKDDLLKRAEIQLKELPKQEQEIHALRKRVELTPGVCIIRDELENVKANSEQEVANLRTRYAMQSAQMRERDSRIEQLEKRLHEISEKYAFAEHKSNGVAEKCGELEKELAMNLEKIRKVESESEDVDKLIEHFNALFKQIRELRPDLNIAAVLPSELSPTTHFNQQIAESPSLTNSEDHIITSDRLSPGLLGANSPGISRNTSSVSLSAAGGVGYCDSCLASRRELNVFKSRIAQLQGKLGTLEINHEKTKREHESAADLLRERIIELETNQNKRYSQLTANAREKVAELEDELQKQRARMLEIVAEKDREIEFTKSSLAAFYSRNYGPYPPSGDSQHNLPMDPPQQPTRKYSVSSPLDSPGFSSTHQPQSYKKSFRITNQKQPPSSPLCKDAVANSDICRDLTEDNVGAASSEVGCGSPISAQSNEHLDFSASFQSSLQNRRKSSRPVSFHFGGEGSLIAGAAARNIFYEQELCKREQEIGELRNVIRLLEMKVRDIEQAMLLKDVQYLQIIETLKEEIRILESRLSLASSQTNLAYLRNIFVQFLNQNSANGRKHILKAIGAVLQLTPIEMGRVDQKFTITKLMSAAATQRLQAKRQTLDEAYAPPANFLEIEVVNPNRYTDYEVRLRTNLPVFKHKESSVRRRYSDFEWLRNELERDSKIIVPLLPGKALKRQLPFRNDDGIFDETFIEERRKGLEQFLNKVAGHPLAQNEKSLHIFLQMTELDKNYIPGRIRTA